jgi:hypothetical protein
MPKTRDQRCTLAIRTFFDQYDLKYNLVNLNIRGYSAARYELLIPLKIDIIEPEYNLIESNLNWINRHIDQELPDANTVCSEFSTMFTPHETQFTFLRIHDTVLNEIGIMFKLMVQYYKSDMPFPEDEITMIQRNSQLEHQNKILQNRLDVYDNEVGNYVHILQRQNARFHRKYIVNKREVAQCADLFLDKYSKITDSYRNLLRKCYIKLDISTENCPVCYESIPNDNLFVTPCNHILCTECSSKCNNSCPLCRQELCFIKT